MNKKILLIIPVALIISAGIYFYKNKNESPTLTTKEKSTTTVNTLTDLSGHWFTPHAATYSLDFTSDKFTFNEFYPDSRLKANGKYSINKNIITLHFSDTKQKNMILYLSSDKDSNYYLKNTELGQYFVKSDTKKDIVTTPTTNKNNSAQTEIANSVMFECANSDTIYGYFYTNGILDLSIYTQHGLKLQEKLFNSGSSTKYYSKDNSLIFGNAEKDESIFIQKNNAVIENCKFEKFIEQQ